MHVAVEMLEDSHRDIRRGMQNVSEKQVLANKAVELLQMLKHVSPNYSDLKFILRRPTQEEPSSIPHVPLSQPAVSKNNAISQATQSNIGNLDPELYSAFMDCICMQNVVQLETFDVFDLSAQSDSENRKNVVFDSKFKVVPPRLV